MVFAKDLQSQATQGVHEDWISAVFVVMNLIVIVVAIIIVEVVPPPSLWVGGCRPPPKFPLDFLLNSYKK